MKSEELELGPCIVTLIGTELGLHKRDSESLELWWFGSDPPDGIPEPRVFLEAIQKRRIRAFPPPWAAILYDRLHQRCWICNDPVGLHHLYLLSNKKTFVVGPDCLEIAKTDRVTIDPIAAYELLTRGNPQGGRTLFLEIKCLEPATLIECTPERITERRYWWPPDPEPIDPKEATDKYISAITSAIVKHYRAGEAQELTFGRDSLMILSVLINQGIHPKTWTHGEEGDQDVIGASRRAQRLGIEHTTIRLEPLLTKSPEELLELVTRFLLASGGQANAVSYGHLPWVIDQLGAPGSITGVGGEVFRGFYYQWLGGKYLPRWLGKFFLLHGKIKAEMPFPSPLVNNIVARRGDAVICADLKQALKPGALVWHSSDVYYLMHRMHYFAATTFSAVNRWIKVRMPLFDPEVLDCLQFLPISLREWSGGLVKEVTSRMLPPDSLQEESSFSYETTGYRLKRLVQRTTELRGRPYAGFVECVSRKLFSNPSALACLDPSCMITAGLYNSDELRRLVDRIRARVGEPIPSILGGIFTIEMAARMAKSDGVALSD